MKEARIVLMCGRSGCGKTTIAKALRDMCGINIIRSRTTRAMRPTETVDDTSGSVFSSIQDYQRDFNTGVVFESNKIDSNYYWTRIEDVTKEGLSFLAVDEKGLLSFPPLCEEYNKSHIDVKILCTSIMIETNDKVVSKRLKTAGVTREEITKRMTRSVDSLSALKIMRSNCDLIIDNHEDVSITISKIMSLMNNFKWA